MLKNIIILLLSLTLLGACDGDNSTNNNPPNESGINNPGSESGNHNPPEVTLKYISLSANKNSLYIGESAQLSAMAKYSDDSTKDITNKIEWTSTESNYTYSSATKGLVYGIHAGTKPITVSFDGKTSKAIDLTIKPTLFYVISNNIYGTAKIYAPYGLISNDFEHNIYSLVVIDDKVYGCCTISNKGYDNILGTIDLTKSIHDWQLFNNESNILESDEENITNLKAINHNLIINTLERTYNTSATYYWDATNNKWIDMLLEGTPIVQEGIRIYAIGHFFPISNDYDINYANISEHLPIKKTQWSTFVSATNAGGCKGDLHIVNNHMYSISKGVDDFCMVSIDMTKPTAAWNYPRFPVLDDLWTKSSIVIENSIYVSFEQNGLHRNKVYKLYNLEANTPTLTDITLPDANSDDVILASIGTTLYAGASDGTIWILDTTNPSASWHKDNELSHAGSDPITTMYVAY